MRNRLTDKIRQEPPWTMMFADDIVICNESRIEIEMSLERWRSAIERRGMKVSKDKTEYMQVNEREDSGMVQLNGVETGILSKVYPLPCACGLLGSLILFLKDSSCG
ncbi:hypothetical protein QTP86_011743 [Hemibagrus guttatus]|nr:hypothetical protein QTP86_011743 [Hemibagrus guttatus]